MAKVKKEKLSLEELLELALVKEEDRPYEVPGNWVWTYITNLFNNLTSSNKKIQQKNYLEEGEYAIVDQGKDLIGGYTNDRTSTFDGELPVVVFGDHTRIVKYIEFPFVQGADGVKILKALKGIDDRFFYYLLKNVRISDLGYRRHFPLFPTIVCPIPPLAEQKRIVAVIESLFEKLHAAKELAQNALDSFENRKAAILHKAFTGELTGKWREENGVSLDEWEETIVGKLCNCIVPGRDKPKNFTGTIPWITTPNIEGDYISIASAELFLTVEEINQVRAKIIPVGSVVMSCVGRFGLSAIVENECVINQQLHAFLPSNLINNRFLMYNIRYLKDYMSGKATSTTIAYLNKTACNSLPINLPTLLEQKEIVRILDNILENEQRAKELCNVIEKIDLMKKAILARAFRGEIGTNDPEEESAVELLKEVLKKKI